MESLITSWQSDVDAGNDGLDHPELATVFINATGLNITGVTDPLTALDQLEVYLGIPGVGDSDGTQDFGEGGRYLGTLIRGVDFTIDGLTR